MCMYVRMDVRGSLLRIRDQHPLLGQDFESWLLKGMWQRLEDHRGIITNPMGLPSERRCSKSGLGFEM